LSRSCDGPRYWLEQRGFQRSEFRDPDPLPFKQPERIMKIGEVNAAVQSTLPVFAPGQLCRFAKQQKSFEFVATVQNGGITYTSNGENEDWNLTRVTEGFFPTLGIQPLAGRTFTVADMSSNAPGTAILSFHLWQNKIWRRS